MHGQVRVRKVVSLVDTAPTILDLVGLPPPACQAPAGSVLVSDNVVETCHEHRGRFEALGAVTVKGLVEPLPLNRLRPLAVSDGS